MSLETTLTYFETLCFGPEEHSNRPQSEHLLSQPEKRRRMYRDLFYATLCDAIQQAMPISFRVLGTATITHLWTSFFSTRRLTSRFYRHIARDFVTYLEIAPSSSLSPLMLDLVRHEYARYALSLSGISQPSPGSLKESDTPLENVRLVWNPVSTLNRYRYPVHTLAKDTPLPITLPEDTTTLLYARDPQSHTIYTLILNDDETALADLLMAHHQVDPLEIEPIHLDTQASHLLTIRDVSRQLASRATQGTALDLMQSLSRFLNSHALLGMI